MHCDTGEPGKRGAEGNELGTEGHIPDLTHTDTENRQLRRDEV